MMFDDRLSFEEENEESVKIRFEFACSRLMLEVLDPMNRDCDRVVAAPPKLMQCMPSKRTASKR
jgi:hypothetical protein